MQCRVVKEQRTTDAGAQCCSQWAFKRQACRPSGLGRILPGAKDGAAHPHIRTAHLNCLLEISTHSHAQLNLSFRQP